MTIQWLLTGAAVLVAVGALIKVRRLARRLERLTESYWELRYEYGQLRARVTRLEPPVSEPGAPGINVAQEPARPASNFVPLSSLKR